MKNPSFFILVIFVFAKKCVFLMANGEVGYGRLTELISGGQSVNDWTTSRQSENGLYHRWVYYNYLKKFKIVHLILFQTQTELKLINFTMKWIILWTYIKIAHHFYYELIKIKFTNFVLLKVILLWNGLLILPTNYKYILWAYLQTYTVTPSNIKSILINFYTCIHINKQY